MTSASPVCVGLSPPVRGSRQKLHILQMSLQVYPRPCGGAFASQSMKVLVLRSIPARAGEPPTWSPGASRKRVYPRPCGGAVIAGRIDGALMGLSPPVRGSLHRRGSHPGDERSIPARAGEPGGCGQGQHQQQVYPRPCGGALDLSDVTFSYGGLSPPVRGSLAEHLAGHRLVRSIPARAGEPGRCPIRPSISGVYPRPCGGAGPRSGAWKSGGGLSPPVRGSRLSLHRTGCKRRSIPARAGEPSGGRWPRPRAAVYPRPCGGACRRCSCGQARSRSIPARAGEPPFSVTSLLVTTGLSPPVRGSHRTGCRPLGGSGSIPARAGEPRPRGALVRAGRVYPRPCGGAALGQHAVHAHDGLSPPVRGSRMLETDYKQYRRSIPARAGEPVPGLRPASKSAVYPRPCGGALYKFRRIVGNVGLSPPVRGSRASSAVSRPWERSIPARAGEPRSSRRRTMMHRVYPRPCGGASPFQLENPPPAGLSPPVRGSRRQDESVTILSGSIPARAGEPSLCCTCG